MKRFFFLLLAVTAVAAAYCGAEAALAPPSVDVIEITASDRVTAVLQSELFGVAAVMISAAFSALVGSQWWKDRTTRRQRMLASIASSAVAWVYRRHVRPLKDAQPEGLTDVQKAEAQDMAIDVIREDAKSKGFTHAALDDQRAMEALVQDSVKRAKAPAVRTAPSTKGA